MNKRILLDIGGQKDRSGKTDWLVVDVRKGADVRVDLLDGLIPLKSASTDLIYCCHTMEHIFKDKVSSVLYEFYRILKPDGVIRIVVPDLELFAKAYVTKDVAFWQKLPYFQSLINEGLPMGGAFSFAVATALQSRFYGNTGNGHVNAFDYEYFEYLLDEIGFDNIKKHQYLKTDCSEFLHVEQHVPSLNAQNSNNKDVSLYIEAQKPDDKLVVKISGLQARLINIILKLCKIFCPSVSVKLHNLITKALHNKEKTKQKLKEKIGISDRT